VLHRSIGDEYLVTVAPCGGQCLGFLVNDVAPYLENPETRVLYVGDLDLAGGDIEGNTRRVLEQHTGQLFDKDTWERVLLPEAQAEDLRRRGVEPVRKKDKRFKGGRPHDAYEAEAIGQRAVIDIVRERLDALLPEPLDRVLGPLSHLRLALTAGRR
jgi:hypothetical protein